MTASHALEAVDLHACCDDEMLGVNTGDQVEVDES